jgi:hypothetical protein
MHIPATPSVRKSRRHLISTKHLGAAVVSALGVGAVELVAPQVAEAWGCNVSRGGASTWNIWGRYAYCDFSPNQGTAWQLINHNNGHQNPANEAKNEAGQSDRIQACYTQYRHYCGTIHSGCDGCMVESRYSYVTNSQLSVKAWNGPLDSRSLLWAWAEWGR